MDNAGTIPQSVQRAVATYAERGQWLGIATGLIAGVSAAVAIALVCMVADRYMFLPQWVRSAGPRVATVALLAGVVGALVAWYRQHDPFRIAVRLDRAFPHHADRWSSSLDLAEQINVGRTVGSSALVDRLFAETELLPG